MSVLDLLFPKICLECQKGSTYICDRCLAKINTASPICPICERPSIDGMTHIKCQRPQSLDGLTSVWLYEGVIRRAILAMKYRFASDIAKEIVARALSDLKAREVQLKGTLVSVPLHRTRYNWRGFNQAEEMGKPLSRGLGLKFAPLLIRKRGTIPQTELGEEARLKNLRGVFGLARGCEVAGSYVLFDDVFTTGSTLKEAAKVLKRGGAERVWGLTIAR